MFKSIFLCVMIAIGYIQCGLIDDSNDTNVQINVPLINATILNSEISKQIQSFQLANLSQTIGGNSPENGMEGYYSWLNFLKTSTTTHSNNASDPLSLIHAINVTTLPIKPE